MSEPVEQPTPRSRKLPRCVICNRKGKHGASHEVPDYPILQPRYPNNTKWCGRCVKKNKRILENPQQILSEELKKYEKDFATASQDLDSIQERSAQNDDKHTRKVITRLRFSLKRVINLISIHLIELQGYLNHHLSYRLSDHSLRHQTISHIYNSSQIFQIIYVQVQKLVFDLITVQVPCPAETGKNISVEKKFKRIIKRAMRKQAKFEEEDMRLFGWTREEISRTADFLCLYNGSLLSQLNDDSIEKLANEIWKRVHSYMEVHNLFTLSKIDLKLATKEGQGTRGFLSKGIELHKRDNSIVNSDELLANPLITENQLSRIEHLKNRNQIFQSFENQLQTLEKDLFELHITATLINETLEKTSATATSVLVSTETTVDTSGPMYYCMSYDQLEEYACLHRSGVRIAQGSIVDYVKAKYFPKRDFSQGLIVDLSKQNLRSINLRNADLRGSRFVGVDLTRSILNGANLTGVSFEGSKMQYCSLTDAILDQTNFHYADLWGAIKGVSFQPDENVNEAKQRKISILEACIETFGRLIKNTEGVIPIIDRRYIFYHLASRKGIRNKRSTLPEKHLLEKNYLENSVITKDGLAYVTYETAGFEEAWKTLISFSTEINRLSAHVRLYLELLDTMDKAIDAPIETDTRSKLTEKRTKYRNDVLQRGRELFLLRFATEQKVLQSKYLSKYISMFGKSVGVWKPDLKPPNDIIDLSELNLTRLDIGGLDMANVRVTVDQLSRVSGISTATGISDEVRNAVKLRKYEVSLSMITQAEKEVEECRIIIEDLPYIDHLACSGTAPDLSTLSEISLKVLAYLTFLSSPINFSDSSSPLHPLNIDYTLSDFMKKDLETVRKDLISILQLRNFKLSKEITSLVWCSKLNILHNKVADAVFLVVSDISRVINDLPDEEQKTINTSVTALKAKRDQILDKSTVNCKLAEQHYVEMVIENLNGEPDIIYGGNATSRMRDILELARDKHIVLDLRKADLKHVKFDELSLSNARMLLTLEQHKTLLTPVQRNEREQLLFKSVKDNNLISLTECISTGVDIECTYQNLSDDEDDNQGNSPLAFAALLGRMRITKKLIKYGANPNVKTNLGYTILEHLARVFESTETQNQTQIRLSIIGFFVRKGVYMDLHSAAALGDLKTVRNLSKDPTLLNSLNELGGRSPLHMAIEYGRRDVVIVLLAAGADRNISGKMAIQFTPLQYACVHGKIQIVQLLTQHSTQLDCVDRKGRSLVTLAAENGHNELAKLLLDFGAPIQVKSIVLLEDLHRLKNFVQSIGGINKVLRSYGLGHTLLHIAVQEGSIVVVKWLLDNAADPMVLDDFKKTSIQLACSKGDTDIMNLLLISTKKIHEGKLPTPKDFEMYIREAMFAGHSDIIKLLVENGADITYRFNPTNTPHLHLAIRQESVPSPNYYSGPTNFNQLGISNILAWKEKFGTSNRNLGKLYSPRKQYSPAPILQDTNINHHNYVEIVKTLLKKGANPSQPDDHGNTPLHMAARVGSVPMMAAILSANITHIFNNEGRSVADVWQRDRSELDVLLKPLEQVFSFYSEKVPAFGGELSALDIPKSITTRIFAFLDRKTLHIIVPCVSHKWRILYQDFVLEKKRKKLGLI